MEIILKIEGLPQIAQLISVVSHGKESLQRDWKGWKSKGFEGCLRNFSITVRWKEN